MIFKSQEYLEDNRGEKKERQDFDPLSHLEYTIFEEEKC